MYIEEIFTENFLENTPKNQLGRSFWKNVSSIFEDVVDVFVAPFKSIGDALTDAVSEILKFGINISSDLITTSIVHIEDWTKYGVYIQAGLTLIAGITIGFLTGPVLGVISKGLGVSEQTLQTIVTISSSAQKFSTQIKSVKQKEKQINRNQEVIDKVIATYQQKFENLQKSYEFFNTLGAFCSIYLQEYPNAQHKLLKDYYTGIIDGTEISRICGQVLKSYMIQTNLIPCLNISVFTMEWGVMKLYERAGINHVQDEDIDFLIKQITSGQLSSKFSANGIYLDQVSDLNANDILIMKSYVFKTIEYKYNPADKILIPAYQPENDEIIPDKIISDNTENPTQSETQSEKKIVPSKYFFANNEFKSDLIKDIAEHSLTKEELI